MKVKLSAYVADKIYIGSRNNPNDHTLSIWAIHPLEKRPLTIEDTNKIYGQLVVHRLEDTDPIEAPDLTIHVTKFSKTHMDNVVKNNIWYITKNE